jgi:hypothetical protein
MDPSVHVERRQIGNQLPRFGLDRVDLRALDMRRIASSALAQRRRPACELIRKAIRRNWLAHGELPFDDVAEDGGGALRQSDERLGNDLRVVGHLGGPLHEVPAHASADGARK